MDKQQLFLPSAFQGQTLTEFQLTSTGGVSISDASIQGLTFVTAAAVPAPAMAVFAGTAGLAFAAFARLRRRLA